jgi:hypothetical protein
MVSLFTDGVVGRDAAGKGKGKGKGAAAPAPYVPPPPVPTKEKQSGPKRGQKGKMKKMKDRYSEQDDDDRLLASIALGHVKPTGTAGGTGKSLPSTIRPVTKRFRALTLLIRFLLMLNCAARTVGRAFIRFALSGCTLRQ